MILYVEFTKQQTFLPKSCTCKLQRKERFGTITDAEMAQISRYQFKKDVNISDDEDSVLTMQFLKMYLHKGTYVKRLQHLLPSTYSTEGQTQKLSSIHNFYKGLLGKKLQELKENAHNLLSFNIQSTGTQSQSGCSSCSNECDSCAAFQYGVSMVW